MDYLTAVSNITLEHEAARRKSVEAVRTVIRFYTDGGGRLSLDPIPARGTVCSCCPRRAVLFASVQAAEWQFCRRCLATLIVGGK